jgi:hypothetical protein
MGGTDLGFVVFGLQQRDDVADVDFPVDACDAGALNPHRCDVEHRTSKLAGLIPVPMVAGGRP